MIIVKLWGGMCNQMFQYAFGYALAREHNDELFFDVDFYKNQPKHVGKRNMISSSLFPVLKINEVKRPTFAHFLENKYINHLIRYRNGCDFILANHHYIIEKLHLYYEPIPYSKDKINFYDGYWQTWKYFINFDNEIRNEFIPKLEIREKVAKWEASIPFEDSVSVHIRRGDYLNKRNQGKDSYLYNSTEYYHRAIKEIQRRLKKPFFCFFSDDIEWCKKEFSYLIDESAFVTNNGDDAAITDLFSIAACKHGILSPSSFSWWGNWLKVPSDESVVIAPKQIDINPHLNPDKWLII